MPVSSGRELQWDNSRGGCEAVRSTALQAVIKQSDDCWRPSRLRRLRTFCSELKRMWISGSVVVTSSSINPITNRNPASTATHKKKTPWSESVSELYRPSDRCLSTKSLPTFADRRCQVVSVTDPYGRILGFLDRSRYFSIKLLLSCTHEAEWTPFQTHYFFLFFFSLHTPTHNLFHTRMPKKTQCNRTLLYKSDYNEGFLRFPLRKCDCVKDDLPDCSIRKFGKTLATSSTVISKSAIITENISW
jgi:hypothetical protein